MPQTIALCPVSTQTKSSHSLHFHVHSHFLLSLSLSPLSLSPTLSSFFTLSPLSLSSSSPLPSFLSSLPLSPLSHSLLISLSPLSPFSYSPFLLSLSSPSPLSSLPSLLPLLSPPLLYLLLSPGLTQEGVYRTVGSNIQVQKLLNAFFGERWPSRSPLPASIQSKANPSGLQRNMHIFLLLFLVLSSYWSCFRNVRLQILSSFCFCSF